MSLETGTRLGPYEILSPLGAGGMGEVYQARDTRLDRTVAIKVLPEHLSGDPDLRSRLEREAKAISALSHPHICTLYDVGHEDGVDFLVMEHIEGETLARRLESGPLPMEEVLRLGIQIADALDRAHRGGVVHRDLKPGNVMLTPSGAKLLDFGLAKLRAPEADEKSADFSHMLTETPPSHPLTEEGTILGTFQYMSPEQLEGNEADARSDLFALGAVLHEMATGQKAFSGKTQASLIGSIMQSEPPPVSALAPMTPPALDRVVKTCLAKDPEQRWHTAHDVKLQLQWIAEGGSQVGLPAPVAARRRSRERLAWAAAAAATLLTLLFAAGYVQRAPAERQVTRFQIPQPEGLPVVGSPKLSPDGRYLAFDATDDTGKNMIWLRPFNGLQAQPMPGTEGAGRPFWSPDSRFVAFFADGKLKKIEASGGPPQSVCDAPSGADGSWSEQGVILYDGRGTDPIMRVSASGGIPTPQIEPDESRGDAQVGWPQFLPGGKRFLYVGFGGSEANVKLASLDSSEVEVVVPGLSRVEYAPPGYLLFVREETLVAQPFDDHSGELTGEPVPVAEDLTTDVVGLAHFSASRSGVLAFRGGEAGFARLVWLDRQGQEAEPVGEPADYSSTSLSPDGRWLAVQLTTPQARTDDIWVRDLVRGVTSRFTFGQGHDVSPLWSPDGNRIAFASQREGDFELAVQTFGGSGETEILLEARGDQYPNSWSPDGRFLSYIDFGSDPRGLWVLPVEEGGEPQVLVQTPFTEVRARFSPDGHWVAYQSNESGRMEIYVQAFPGPGGKWQISTDGGTEPQWSADGTELFYLSLDGKLMSVAVETGEAFEAGIPEALFQTRLQPVTTNNRYLPAADGQRFLVLSPLSKQSLAPTTIVLNWEAELGR